MNNTIKWTYGQQKVAWQWHHATQITIFAILFIIKLLSNDNAGDEHWLGINQLPIFFACNTYLVCGECANYHRFIEIIGERVSGDLENENGYK